VNPRAATRDGLKELLAGGWCEYEFDSKARNGNGSTVRTPSPHPKGDSAELVN
jgi:hypothetical protein